MRNETCITTGFCSQPFNQQIRLNVSFGFYYRVLLVDIKNQFLQKLKLADALTSIFCFLTSGNIGPDRQVVLVQHDVVVVEVDHRLGLGRVDKPGDRLWDSS